MRAVGHDHSAAVPAVASHLGSRSLMRTPWIFASLYFWLVSGCATIPKGVREQVDEAQATGSLAIGSHTLVHTLSFGAGSRSVVKILADRVTCGSSVTAVRIVRSALLPMSRTEAEEVCRDLAAGVEYVRAFSGLPAAPSIRYKIHLIQRGEGFLHRRWTVQPGAGEIEYWFAWDQQDETRADVINTMAHESAHVLAAVLRLPRSQRRREQEPWLAGYCAQLAVTGVLRKEHLAIGPIKSDGKHTSAAVESSHVGWRVAGDLRPYLSGGEVAVGSADGQRLMGHCREKLVAFFDQSEGVADGSRSLVK